MEILLPFPDYKSSVEVLTDEDLIKQLNAVVLTLNQLLGVDEPNRSLDREVGRWTACELQLCELGMTGVEELIRRDYRGPILSDLADHVSWALDMSSENPNMSAPAWFGNTLEHLSHQRELLNRNRSAYSVYFDA